MSQSISQAILSKQNLGHKVQPLKDGKVFVFGSMAVNQARKLAAKGLIEFTSMGEKSEKGGFVYQGVCVVKEIV